MNGVNKNKKYYEEGDLNIFKPAYAKIFILSINFAAKEKQALKSFLVIQTAFIGDVILATPVIEKLHQYFPEAQIDFLLRKGNEGLFADHPYLHEVIVWDKQHRKYLNLQSILKKIRSTHYDYVINLQRFASTGFITAFSGAGCKIGFDKNPYSFLFTKKIKHTIDNVSSPIHECARNIETIIFLTDDTFTNPKLYPSIKNCGDTLRYKDKKYICIAPASVWFTKEFPAEKWIEFISAVTSLKIYLIGGKEDFEKCEFIKKSCNDTSIENLAGKLNLLQTAALMRDAIMNYVNDSAPLHIASAMNAPVTAVFCSTIPAFGFGPLSDHAVVIETKEKLTCRPCGLHGFKTCPEKHFKCAETIDYHELLFSLKS